MLLDTQRSHTLSYLLASLGETVAWCGARGAADPARSLRDTALAPHAFARRPTEVVDSVRRARRTVLGATSIAGRAHLAGGRLVIYEPDRADPGTGARAASEGFFDSMETPAWDTWAAFIGEHGHPGYLVAYVPPSLLELADAGVQRASGLGWLDESPTDLWKWLRTRLV